MGFLDLLFPKICIGCKKSGSYFCSQCEKQAKLHFPQVCPVCERNSIDGLTHVRCKKGFVPNGLISLWDYQGVPKKAIGKLKYKFVRSIASELVIPLVKQLKEAQRVNLDTPEWNRGKFTIVPIPLYWMRENWRGFNQSEELARLLAEKMSSEGGSASGGGWEVVKLLERKAKGRSQVGLKEKERKENIEGVFKVSNSVMCLPSNPIILFDDVWTTGSTMLEATRVLKKAGVKKVWCL